MYMTPWVQRLLVATVAAYVISTGAPRLVYSLAFIPSLALVRPWTLVTYMFLHADLTHLLFNMLGLFFFGPRLESRLGGKGFLALYFLAGIGGALFSFAFERNVPIIGASGAVYGIIGGFAYLWPRDQIYIWAILPVEAWLLATLMVLGSLWAGFSGGGNIAHFAHLGGLAFGFGYVRWKGVQTELRKKRWREGKDGDRPQPAVTLRLPKREAAARWKSIPKEDLHELNRQEVDALLDKISAQGEQSLTAEERAFLDRMAGEN